MRRFGDRLQDILDAIAQIEAEQVKGKAAFDASSLVQVWMVHHLMIIGEAVRGLDPVLKQKYPAVPGREIAGMRNIPVHDYFRINQSIVWQTVEKHVPQLKAEVEKMLAELPAE
ncbi:conserved hypothetical protein [Verrucomicrobia bacterium]|nr:conserved hypothetical protein [Verrucomicrobiota bacterium]